MTSPSLDIAPPLLLDFDGASRGTREFAFFCFSASSFAVCFCSRTASCAALSSPGLTVIREPPLRMTMTRIGRGPAASNNRQRPATGAHSLQFPESSCKPRLQCHWFHRHWLSNRWVPASTSTCFLSAKRLLLPLFNAASIVCFGSNHSSPLPHPPALDE